jgi:hypothetical protein
MWPFLAAPLNYSSMNPDTYAISLSATPLLGPAATVSENVDAVTPEPAAGGLIAVGLLGLIAAARKRK